MPSAIPSTIAGGLAQLNTGGSESHGVHTSDTAPFMPEPYPERDVAGRVVLITGASRGLGHYVVRALRPIYAGEELTYSYIGTGMLCGAEDARVKEEAQLQ